MKDKILKIMKYTLCIEIFICVQLMVILTIKDFIELFIK